MSNLDLIAIIIIGIFAIVGLIRGMLEDIKSPLVLLFAFFTAYPVTNLTSSLFYKIFPIQAIASIIAFIVTFFLLLVLYDLLLKIIFRFLARSFTFRKINRFLGLFSGCLKGFAIIFFALVIYDKLFFDLLIPKSVHESFTFKTVTSFYDSFSSRNLKGEFLDKLTTKKQ